MRAESVASQKMSERLNKIQQAYQGDKKQIAKAQTSPIKQDEIVQGYSDEDRKGNRAGFVYNELLNGIGDIASGLGDVGATLMSSNLGRGYSYNANAEVNQPESEQSIEQRHQVLNDYRENVAPQVRSFFKEKLGADVDKVLENKYRDETFTGALGGLSRTLPAIGGNFLSGGAGAGALFLQSYDNALATLDQSEVGRELDDATKTIYATGIGAVTSALEKFGLDKIMKSETGLVSKILTDRAIKNAVKETGGKVSGDVLEKFLNKEIVDFSGKFAKGGAKIIDGYLTEFSTGATQEGATALGENLLNKATGKPVFDMSQTNTWSGFIKRVAKAGNAEGIGGGLLGTVSALGGFNHSEVKAKEQQIKDIDASLANDQISDVAKEVLVQNKVKLQNDIQEVADKVDETFNKLDDKQKEQVSNIVENKAKIEEAILDPNITTEVKTSLENQSKELDKELSEIKPVEEVKTKAEVITPTEEVKATETIKPIENEPIQVSDTVEDVQAPSVEETAQVADKVLTKAEDDLKALKQVDNKTAKYDASIKRLTEAKNNKTISAKEFDDLKNRFDDVMADSKPKENVNIPVQEPSGKESDNKMVSKESKVDTEAGRDEAKSFAIKEIEKGAINWDGDMFTPRPELGLEWKDIRKGKQDLIDGKDTPASKRLVEAINKAKEKGGYDFVQGAGSAKVNLFAPIDGKLPTNELNKVELDEISSKEDALHKEYLDNFDKIFSKEEQEQELNLLENGTDNKGTVGQNTESSTSKENVSNKETASPTKLEAVKSKQQAIKDRISEKLKAQRGNLSIGFDPSLLPDFIELGATYIEEGVVRLDDLVKRFRNDYKAYGLDDKEITDEQIATEIFGEQKQKEVKQAENLIGLTKDDVIALREELGQEQYEYEVMDNATRITEAKKKIEEGYNIKNLLNKVERKGTFDSAVEVEIAKQYYASLSESIARNPTPELLSERKRLLEIIDLAKTEGGRISQAWDGLTAMEDNLANFLTEESQFKDLTQGEIDNLTEGYKKWKEVEKKYEALQNEAINAARDKKALTEIQKAKIEASKTGNKKLVHEAYKNERSQYVADLRKELKKIRTSTSAVVLPYSRELIALAPFAGKMMRSYVSEGIYDLQTIVKNIHKEFKQDIPELTENDVRDIIAGEYRDPKKTRNAKLSEIYDLQRQAKLEGEIENLQNGIVETKDPVVRRKKSDKIEELENEIKKLKKLHPELSIPSRLNGRKTWLHNRINELKDQIRKGDFEPVEPPTPILLDAEALKLKDEYIKFKEETRARRQHQQEKALSGWNKAIKFGQEALATKRLVQTSIDLSIPFRQGISVMLNPRTIGIGSESYSRMLSSVKSEKNYDRMMFDIEKNPKYLEAKDDGLVFNEVGSLNPEKRDEYHRDHFLYKVKGLGPLLKASERAAAAWTNYARMELYLRGAKALEAQGKTRANSKEAYEQMAARVMVDTGRGKILGVKDKNPGETDSRIKRLLGNTFYGARLMSATFRKLNPAYFFNPKVDRTVRVEALKDMAGYTTGLIAVGLIASALGYSISFDPDDSDFMKLRKGKEVIDITGGQATYIRTYLRLVRAAFLQANPNVNSEDANKYSKFALKSTSNFFRNKLAPNTSYVLNAVTGENSMGEKFDPWEIIKIYPMYTDDIIKSFKEGSPIDLATIIPISISGLGYQTYEKDIRKAKLDYYLNDKPLSKWLNEKQLNIVGDINQEVFNSATGKKEKMTTKQSDEFEKIWAEYIIDELKEQKPELDKMKEKDLTKEVNKIKLEATKYAKYKVTGNLSTVGTIQDDGKTYELTPEQIKERVKLSKEYISDYGDDLKNSYIDTYTEDGMGKNRAERRAVLKVQSKANSYSAKRMIEAEKEAKDGKITWKEKE